MRHSRRQAVLQRECTLAIPAQRDLINPFQALAACGHGERRGEIPAARIGVSAELCVDPAHSRQRLLVQRVTRVAQFVQRNDGDAVPVPQGKIERALRPRSDLAVDDKLMIALEGFVSLPGSAI